WTPGYWAFAGGVYVFETDVRAPVSGVKHIHTACECPVSRRPQQADTGRGHPGAWHPEVPCAIPTPVPRGPHVSVLRARGLVVVGQRGRGFRRLHRSLLTLRLVCHGRRFRRGWRWRVLA